MGMGTVVCGDGWGRDDLEDSCGIWVIPRLHDEASSTSWLDERSSSWLDKRFTMKPAS